MSDRLELSEAVERLYTAFERYSDWSRQISCPCCINPEYLAPLTKKPLRKLSMSDFERYSNSIYVAFAELNDYRHFLPRILELVAIADKPSLFYEAQSVLAKIESLHFRTWPKAEQVAIDDFLSSWWRYTVDTYAACAVDVLQGLAQIYHDLRPFLAYWRQSSSESALRHVGDCWTSLAARGSFSKSQHKQCMDWICSPDTRRWLEESYLKFSDRPWADEFAAQLDALLSLVPTEQSDSTEECAESPCIPDGEQVERVIAKPQKAARRPKNKTRRIGKEIRH